MTSCLPWFDWNLVGFLENGGVLVVAESDRLWLVWRQLSTDSNCRSKFKLCLITFDQYFSFHSWWGRHWLISSSFTNSILLKRPIANPRNYDIQLRITVIFASRYLFELRIKSLYPLNSFAKFSIHLLVQHYKISASVHK